MNIISFCKYSLALLTFAFPMFGEEILSSTEFSNFGKNWKLIKHNGAEGVLIRDANGEYSLRKKTAKGFLELRRTLPVKLSKGKIWYFRGEYRSTHSPEGTMLLFRFAHKAERVATYQSDGDKATTIGTESIIRNCTTGQWRQRNFAVKPTIDVEWYPSIQLVGNPTTVTLRRLTLNDVSNVRQEITKPQELTPGYSLEEVRQHLLQRTSSQARLVRNTAGTMSIELDGKLIPSVLYKPPVDRKHWRIESFQKAGIPLVLITVPLCHQLNKPGIPLRGGKYAWELLDNAVYHALRYSPDVCIVLNLIIYEPYLGWGDEAPEDIWQNEKGEYGVGNNCHLVKFVPLNGQRGTLGWWPSYSSERWRRDVCKNIRDMAQHVMTQDYGKAIVGVSFSSGDDGQFQYRHDDYSPVAQKSYRLFLKKKYGTIAALNSRWKSKYKDFSEIPIPVRPSTRIPFLAPGAYPDYREFQYYEGWTLREAFASAVKKGFTKPVLTISYGTPDTFTANYLHLAPSMDAVTTVMSYPYRLNGYPTGFGMPPVEYALNNKLWIEELDLRSWLSSSGNEFVDRAQGALVTPEEWRSGHMKLTGLALAARQGYWYYSMDYQKGLFFGAPEIMDAIGKNILFAQQCLQMPPREFHPDVCLVTSDANDMYTAEKPHASHTNLNGQGNSLPLQNFAYETSGVPMDKASLQSIMKHPHLQTYKIYIFPHVTYLSKEERAFIREKLQKNQKWIIWIHATGYIDENGKSVENIRSLTGFHVKTKEAYARQAVYTADKSTFTKGIPPYLSLGELRLFAEAFKGLSLWGQLSQEFYIIPTKKEHIFARYHNGQIAGAMLKYPQWTSIYLAAPSSLSASLLNRIAQRVNAYRAGKAGHSIAMNGNFLSIHPMYDDKWEFILPVGVTSVQDAFTGKIIGKGERVTIPLVTGVTRWFLLIGDEDKTKDTSNRDK